MAIDITESEFEKIADIVKRESGITYTYKKKYLIENRLRKRLEKLNIPSFSRYLKFLAKGDSGGSETEELINAVTTNETSFLRNPIQYKSFSEITLPEVVNHNKKIERKKLRIWSSASSSGEEIYTIAILLKESRLIPADWEVELYASDINREMLAKARTGIYGKHTLRNMPKEYLEKYFAKKDGDFIIKKDLLPPVRFDKINLIEQEKAHHLRDFDVVFCCNVLIYFNDEARNKAISGIYDSLTRPGYLFIGHSESLRNVSKDFTLINVMGSPTYKKEL